MRNFILITILGFSVSSFAGNGSGTMGAKAVAATVQLSTKASLNLASIEAVAPAAAGFEGDWNPTEITCTENGQQVPYNQAFPRMSFQVTQESPAVLTFVETSFVNGEPSPTTFQLKTESGKLQNVDFRNDLQIAPDKSGFAYESQAQNYSGGKPAYNVSEGYIVEVISANELRMSYYQTITSNDGQTHSESTVVLKLTK